MTARSRTRLAPQPARARRRRRRSSIARRSSGRCGRRRRRCSWCTRPRTAACRSRTAWRCYAALRAAGVPVELHVYERGEHGFGFRRRSRADLGVAGAVDRLDAGPRLAAAGRGDARRRRAAAVRRGRAALGARRRGPAQGRPRRRHLPQSDPGRRSSRPVDPQGRRRLLHDVLVVRRLSGPGHLALARPRQLAADRPGAAQERRRGVGARSRQARAAATTSTSRASVPIDRTT